MVVNTKKKNRVVKSKIMIKSQILYFRLFNKTENAENHCFIG